MTVTVKHASLTGVAANPDVLVDGPKWDAEHTVTGLENVDNTSDASKPVSTAQAAADAVVAANAATADAVVAANAANASNLTSGTVPAARLLSGHPIVIYADGQSNISLTKTFSWSPNVNAKIWNNTQDAVNTGTAFTALSSSTIGFAEKIASDIADANPTHPVYLIKNGYTGQAISHWLAATGAPDMYANGTANLVAALAAISVTKIDFYVRWQGEADQTPSINTSYVANFATMMGRYWGNTYFPRETPALICSISSTADSGSANADVFNDVLQQVVNADPDKRRFLYVGALAGATYWDAGNPGHPTGQGEFSLGAMGASVLMNGPGRNTLPGILSDPASGQLVLGNPGKASSSVKLAINSNSVAATLPTTSGLLEIAGADSANPFWVVDAFGGVGGYIGRASRGTLASPTALQSGDLLVFYGAQGYDGSAWNSANVANFKIAASENWTNAAHGTAPIISGTITGTLTGADFVRFDSGSITVYGTTSGSIKFAVPAAAGSNTITWPAGTTNFSATGGTSQVVKQTTAGGAFTVATVAVSDLSDAAWTSYTPTITAGSGTITTSSATGRYKQMGKTVFVEAMITITTAGTGAGLLKASLPFAAAAFDYIGVAIETAATGKSGAGRIQASTSTINCIDSTFTTFIASGNVVALTATYEVP